jgi:hypothetical protein
MKLLTYGELLRATKFTMEKHYGGFSVALMMDGGTLSFNHVLWRIFLAVWKLTKFVIWCAILFITWWYIHWLVSVAWIGWAVWHIWRKRKSLKETREMLSDFRRFYDNFGNLTLSWQTVLDDMRDNRQTIFNWEGPILKLAELRAKEL